MDSAVQGTGRHLPEISTDIPLGISDGDGWLAFVWLAFVWLACGMAGGVTGVMAF